jgi:hypothetical protein
MLQDISKKNEPFGIFDTVEVEFINGDLIEHLRGYVINCILEDDIYYMFSNVVIGFNNEKSPSYLGSHLKVTLCRMVLFEKWDYKKDFAYETSKILMGYDEI